MITIYNGADMARALAGPIDPDLEAILLDRLELLAEFLSDWDLGDIAHFIVVELGDKIEAIEDELGISPFSNIVNDIRYPDPAFEPSWEFCIDRGTFLDAVFAFSDGGPGIVLLVPDRDGVMPELREMLKAYATTNPNSTG